jgi:hypothetical protein
MIVSRLLLIVPLLLLTAAVPEVPPAPAAPDAPPAVTAPNVPPAPTVSNTPSATMAPGAPPVPIAPNAAPTPTIPKTPTAATVSKLPPSVALQTFAPKEAMPVLGHRVVEPDGNVVARLIEVLVAPDGQPVAAVLDFGGFMGVGIRKIAVHWTTLRFEPGNAEHRIILTLTPDEIKAAPEYKDPEKPAPVVVPVTPEPKAGPQ